MNLLIFNIFYATTSSMKYVISK